MEEEVREAGEERTVLGTVSAVSVSEPLRVSARPVVCSPCLRASVRDHETASRTRHAAWRAAGADGVETHTKA
jgi:hypothetical protein